jgi:exonuclease III
MLDRLTHKNLQTNPYATFLFVERGEGYQGVRLFLKKTREQTDPEVIEKISRHCANHGGGRGPKFLVLFRLEKILDLIGPGTPDIAP